MAWRHLWIYLVVHAKLDFSEIAQKCCKSGVQKSENDAKQTDHSRERWLSVNPFLNGKPGIFFSGSAHVWPHVRVLERVKTYPRGVCIVLDEFIECLFVMLQKMKIIIKLGQTFRKLKLYRVMSFMDAYWVRTFIVTSLWTDIELGRLSS